MFKSARCLHQPPVRSADVHSIFERPRPQYRRRQSKLNISVCIVFDFPIKLYASSNNLIRGEGAIDGLHCFAFRHLDGLCGYCLRISLHCCKSL